MKKISVLFLQSVIILIGIMALAILIWFPLNEGRARDLDLLSIYTNEFILYGYVASIPFFVALYNAFKLLGYIRQNKVFSSNTVKTLTNMKYCAIVFSILILAAGLYMRIFHNKENDPDDSVGFFVISFVITFVSIVVATATAIVEKIVQNAIDMKSELYRPH